MQMLAYQIDKFVMSRRLRPEAFLRRLARHPTIGEELQELAALLQHAALWVQSRCPFGGHALVPACCLWCARSTYGCGVADSGTSRAVPGRCPATGRQEDGTLS